MAFTKREISRLRIASETSNLVGWVVGCCGWRGEISIWAKPSNKDLTKDVTVIQKKLSSLTGSKACLDLWEPHITLGAGVELSDLELEGFYNGMKEVANNFHPFEVQIEGYGFMDNWHGAKIGFSPYVVYLGIKNNVEIQSLARAIDSKNKKYKKYYGLIRSFFPFSPHLTVAFRDLSKDGFEKAKGLFKDEHFSRRTIIDHIALAREDENGKCTKYKRFYMR